jgi:hypothetical protein
MISANTIMRHAEDKAAITVQRRGPDTVFLLFEDVTLLTATGDIREVEMERLSVARRIERMERQLATLDRMIEAMK